MSSTIEKWAGWLDHGKTIFDILVALGLGKIVQIMAVKFTSIPSIWLTPIWLLSSAVVLWVLLTLLKRKVTSQSTVQSASNVLVPAAAPNFDATAFFKNAYYSPLQGQIEANVRQSATQNRPNDREGFFVQLIAIGLLSFTYDIVWAYIYRSQILLLMELNRRVLPIAEVKPHYEKAAAEYPNVYTNYSFEQWLNFLRTNVVVLDLPGNVIGITERGKDFLKY